jgi:hypothetical protein
MTTVTADDIRVLAKASDAGAALARVGDRIEVVPDGGQAEVVYPKTRLVAEYGEEITDIDAEVLAGRLTAQLSGDRERPDTDVAPAAGTVEPPD